MLSYPAGIAVSNHVLITLSDALRHRRRRPARRCCAGDRRQRLPRLGVPGPRNDDGPPTRNRRTPSLVGQPEGVNSAHARQRGPGERANAQLKAWRIFRKIRCCPMRVTDLVKAILVLIHAG